MIYYAMREAALSGLEHIYMVVNKQKPSLRTYLESGQFEDQHITFIDQPVPLGSGEAIYRIKGMIGEEPFALMMPDFLLFGSSPALSQMVPLYERFEQDIVGVVRIGKTEAEGFGNVGIFEPTPWEKGLGILEGQIVRGRVVRIMDFGAFVEVSPGVEGLVHVSEISYERISHPRRVLQEGQDVQVRVLGIDHERRRISLSIKEARGAEPADVEGIEGEAGPPRLEVGAQFIGVVEKVMSGGLLVRLPAAGPGVRGLLPQEELAQPGRADLKKRLPLGREVSVEVLAIADDGKIRLSQKAATEREEQKDYRRYVDQGDRKSAKLATFGDLFKDLKLPTKKD